MACLIYLHGFNSSEQSHKAQLLQRYAQQSGLVEAFLAPRLSWQPQIAIAQVASLIESQLDTGVTLVGSSLGGYYASFLAQRYGVNAVLVNPAVAAYRLLADYLGPHINPYTHERYHLTDEHRQQLLALDTGHSHVTQLWLMLQTGDDILDYRQALSAFPNAKLTLEQGGDHSFQGFERHIPDILRFAKML